MLVFNLYVILKGWSILSLSLCVCRDLYNGDVHSQGYVYELYCIHQSDVPIKVASSQCKHLAEQLWPLSREAIAPFSLIN